MAINPDGSIVVGPEVVALVGSGFVRQILEAEHRRAGVPMHSALVKFLDECSHLRRGRSIAEKSSIDRFPPETPPVSLRDHLSVRQVAEATGTTVQNIRQRCRRGTLRAIRDDRGRWRIDRSELT